MQTVEERVKAVTARVLRVDAKGLKPEDRFTTDLGGRAFSRSSWWRISKRNSASKWTKTPPCPCKP